jgi:nucleoside phosphorylase
MTTHRAERRVVVLAPMPLEMDAIVKAFGLTRTGDDKEAPWSGRVGNSEVTAVHIGMGPPLTRVAINRLLDEETSPDHIMIAGICGGLDPDLAVGTLINPETIVEHASGVAYAHTPPGGAPTKGKLVTTEEATLDHDQSRRFFAEGFLGVDMESSAVAEVCSARDCPWSVYRCIGDRFFDGLLDERIIAVTNQDGSGNMEGLRKLLADEPDLAAKLDQLSRDTSLAARLAAEAAVRACIALDG